VEVVERGRATGRLLALQIKAGRSWFREAAPSSGWVFRGSLASKFREVVGDTGG
jgi:hypothetical protein